VRILSLGAIRVAPCLLLAASIALRATPSVAIVNGSFDVAHPAVAVIIHADSSICTGTLIFANVLLSAAHCFSDVDPTNFLILFGNDPLNPDFTVTASQVVPNPSYDARTRAHDSLVIVLDQSPLGVTPMPWLMGDPAGVAIQPGEVFTLVGFGATQVGGNAGVRHSVQLTASATTSQQFMADGTAASPCSYDDGGPAIADVGGEPTVIGILSSFDSGCNQMSTYQRSASDGIFISSYLPEPSATMLSSAALLVILALGRSHRKTPAHVGIAT